MVKSLGEISNNNSSTRAQEQTQKVPKRGEKNETKKKENEVGRSHRMALEMEQKLQAFLGNYFKK